MIAFTGFGIRGIDRAARLQALIDDPTLSTEEVNREVVASKIISARIKWDMQEALRNRPNVSAVFRCCNI